MANCINNITPDACSQQTFIPFTTDTVDEDFLDCVGIQINQLQSLCIPPYAGLLPQFGLFQMLSMTCVPISMDVF